jgi:hypothetical protein
LALLGGTVNGKLGNEAGLTVDEDFALTMTWDGINGEFKIRRM